MRTKIIDCFTLVLLAFLCVLCAVVYLPRVFGLDVYYVETDSMTPALQVGCAVFDKEVSFDEIEVNDIITFTNDEESKFCTHRVVEIDEEGKSLVTKGDNNSMRDPYNTDFKYVKGKVVFKLPYFGYLFRILNTAAARITAVSLAVVLLAVEIELFKSRKKEGGNDD